MPLSHKSKEGTNTMELTRSDCEILSFLKDKDFTDQYRSATLREIMQITKNSRPTTYRKMMNLCEYGYVRKGCKSVNADTFYLDSKAYRIIGGKDPNATNQQMKKRNTVSYNNNQIRKKLVDIINRGLQLKAVSVNAGLSESELSRFKNGMDALKESDLKTLAEYLDVLVIPRWNIEGKERKPEKKKSTRDWLFM